MSKTLRNLLVILAVLAAAALGVAYACRDPGILAPPAMGRDRLKELSDEQLVSQLNLDWSWRCYPPQGAPLAVVPEPARHLLAIIRNEGGMLAYGLVSIPAGRLNHPQSEDLESIAAAYDAIGAAAVAACLHQAAGIAAKEGALIEAWRDFLMEKKNRPSRDPFADQDRRLKAELATPAVRRKLVAYLRTHLDALSP